MEFDSATFGASVLAHCVLKKQSLRDAAKETGISVSTLSRITRGEDPDIHNFARLVQWMDVDANLFITPPPAASPREQDQWVELYTSLLNLEIPHDLTKAIMHIVQLVREKKPD